MWARIVGSIVVEITDVDPADRFHPDVAATFLAVPPGLLVAEGWTWSSEAGFAAPAPALAPPIRRIAPLAFRRRLPPPARQAITLAASAALEQGNAGLQTFLDDLAASRYIDLDDPEVAAGVAALQAAGLISTEQAAVLLADGTMDEAR